MKKKQHSTEERNSLVPLTRQEIVSEVRRQVKAIEKEFDQVFTFINKNPKSVTFFGSARFGENSGHSKAASSLAAELARRGFSVLTGGGGGIMEAANKGAYEAGGASLGINIKLPSEQVPNRYLNAEFECAFFFSRKTALAFAAEAYLFFPGGYGTLDEFFEIVTLIQTEKIPAVPIVAFGKDYWEPLRSFIYEQMYVGHNAIKKEDLDLFTITDDPQIALDIIEKSTAAKEAALKKAAAKA